MTDAARRRNYAAVRAWLERHPKYGRYNHACFKAWRDILAAQGINVWGESRPLVKGRLAYSVTVTDPLTEDERIKPKEGQHETEPVQHTRSRRRPKPDEPRGANIAGIAARR